MAVSKYVTLRPDEFLTAAQVGIQRMYDSIENKRKDSLVDKTWMQGLAKHIAGACAEMAYAKAMDKYPHLSNRQFSGGIPDVSTHHEVRYSYKGDCLVVRPNDPDDREYILVTGEIPDLEIVGSMRGSEAKVHTSKLIDVGKLGKPAYFIPREELD